jgi:hypothetical protein
MKVSELKAESATVSITLEPEHPSEAALIALMNGCEAECVWIEGEKPSDKTAKPSPQLQVTVHVKSNSTARAVSRY